MCEKHCDPEMFFAYVPALVHEAGPILVFQFFENERTFSTRMKSEEHHVGGEGIISTDDNTPPQIQAKKQPHVSMEIK